MISPHPSDHFEKLQNFGDSVNKELARYEQYFLSYSSLKIRLLYIYVVATFWYMAHNVGKKVKVERFRVFTLHSPEGMKWTRPKSYQIEEKKKQKPYCALKIF